jgi:hypothetical protein
MNGQYTTWNATRVNNEIGPFIYPYVSSEPLHYLMYTSAQIADHFGSDGPYEGDGNNTIGGDYLPEEYSFLNSLPLSTLGQPTGMSNPPPYMENIRDKVEPYAIRATAGLLYWFAKETGPWPPPGHLYVPGQYSTITQALAAAPSGGTVLVAGPQTVNGYVTVNSGVTLQLNPGSSLIFNSSSTRLLLYGNLNINGSSSSHVTIDGQGYSRSGYLMAPIVVASGGTASIQYADFRNAPYLLTAYTNAANVSVQNCTFTNFGTTSDAKAITAASIAGTMTISSNSITGSNQGIGIYSSSNGTKVSITGNTITNCGTGIRPYSSNASITGNTIHGNLNYGILADNLTSWAVFSYNDIRSNGYGMYLNASAPMIHNNTIIENSSNMFLSASSPDFSQLDHEPGHNVIAYASAPLLNAQNYSSPVLGYDGNAGENSLYGTDLPHAYSLNHSAVYADNTYWGNEEGSCYTDGASIFRAWNPLGYDPNPDPLAKRAIAKTGLASPSTGLGKISDEDHVREVLLRALAAGFRGDKSVAKDSLGWLISNKPNSKYAPLALLALGSFSGLKGDVVDANKAVTVDTDFENQLVTINSAREVSPLRPFALRLLARRAQLGGDSKTAMQYADQLVKEYPGTEHEMVALYDNLVYAIEVDEDLAKAMTFLEILKKKYPESDLTISAKILCGEKVSPGTKKENSPTEAAAIEYGLSAAYPNPFNPTTSIGFSLKSDARVQVKVYDILGREVATLADGMRPAGHHSVVWNASSVSSGVYLVRLEITDAIGNLLLKETGKLLLSK